MGIFPVGTHALCISVLITRLWEEFGSILSSSLAPGLGTCFQIISAHYCNHSGFDAAIHPSWDELLIPWAGSILSALFCKSGIQTQKRISLGTDPSEQPSDFDRELVGSSLRTALPLLTPLSS